MEKQIKTTLIISITIIIVSLMAFTAFMNANARETLTTNGEYSMKVMPDLVVVYFNVDTLDENLELAQDENAKISNQLIETLVSKGIERNKIQTQSFNSFQDYDWTRDGRQERGFRVVHTIKVELSADYENLGSIVDAGISSGALVSYINYELSSETQNSAKAEAIKLATQDARNKAEAMAEGLGGRLGRIVSVSDSSFQYHPWRAYDMAVSSESVQQVATDISPSEQEITARVSVVYRIR